MCCDLYSILDTYASQKLTIDDKKIVSVDRNVQIVYLQNKILFCKVKHLIVTNPKCELLDIFNQFGFLINRNSKQFMERANETKNR